MTGRVLAGLALLVVTAATPAPADEASSYTAEIEKRIQANWVYPSEAARRNESGRVVLEFVVQKDGHVPLIDVVRSSGFDLLDRYARNAVFLAAPFPALPEAARSIDALKLEATFTYILDHGFKIFGVRVVSPPDFKKRLIDAARAREEHDERERRKAIAAKGWPPEIERAIVEQRVILGMTEDQARLALGEPSHVTETITRAGIAAQWVYGSEFLYFENGKLTVIQRSRRP